MNGQLRRDTATRGLVLIGAAALLGMTQPAAAQVPFAGGTLSGVLNAGGRAFTDKPTDREWARFGEYRNFYDGGYVPDAHLKFNSSGRVFAELRAFDVGRNDQRFSLLTYQPGKYTLDLSWNQTPHIYSTTSQLYGGEPTTPGMFSLPATRPVAADFNAAPYLSLVANRWDAGRAALKATPKPGWDLSAEYTRTKKQGDRPMGMAFGSPGSNFREILEPINQITQSLKLSQGIGKSKYRLQMGYDLSVFQNGMDAVQADNPMLAVDAATTGAATGRTALAPDNLAHTLSLTGTAARLPLKTRLIGTISYAWWHQNQAFLPFTRNTAIVTPALPASSLEGDQRTINYQLSASSSPLKNLNLTAKYRRYEMQDKTEELIFPVEVVTDRTLTAGPFEREMHPFSRQIGRFDIGWRAPRVVGLKLGWNWERWNRSDTRETPVTSEHQPRAAVDFELAEWLTVRTAYSHAWRRYDSYAAVMTVELPELRRFDQADRDQDRAEVTAQITPPGKFAFTATYGRNRNNYLVGQNPGYGVRDDRNWSLGGDVSWTPSNRATVYGGYTQERMRVTQQSRVRQPGIFDNTSWDWISNTNDKIHTASAGFQVTVVPDKLELGGQWNFYIGTTDVLSANPTTPTGGTAAQNATATAGNWPSISHKMHRVDGSLRYRMATNWSATFTYGFQRFNESDFRTDGLTPAPAAPAVQGDIFLGSDVLGYRASYIVLTLGYNIGMTPHALVSR